MTKKLICTAKHISIKLIIEKKRMFIKKTEFCFC